MVAGFRMALDKLLHFAVGWMIGSCTIFVFIGSPYAMVISIALAALAGLWKELWDKMGNGTPDVMDFVVTTLGGTVASIIFLVGGLL